jgi:hypothetical protein
MEAVKDIINWKKEKGKSKVINLSLKEQTTKTD